MRKKRWKYICYNELDGMNELYDLNNVLYQLYNSMGNLDSQGVLEDL